MTKNSIGDSCTPQPAEIVFYTIRYRSSETLQRSGAGFMKGLKSGLRLKSETLGSNIVNILLSLWTQTQSISQTGST